MATNKEIANSFITEYLGRAPEFIDVVEYIDEYEDIEYEDQYEEIHNLVVAELDTIAQRFADGEK